MKIHPVNFLAAIVISALLTYGVVSMGAEVSQVVIGVGCFLFLASTLTLMIGLSFEDVRAGVNVKMVSAVFFIVALLLNLAYGIVSFSQGSYIVVSGVLFLLFVVITNALGKTEQ